MILVTISDYLLRYGQVGAYFGARFLYFAILSLGLFSREIHAKMATQAFFDDYQSH